MSGYGHTHPCIRKIALGNCSVERCPNAVRGIGDQNGSSQAPQRTRATISMPRPDTPAIANALTKKRLENQYQRSIRFHEARDRGAVGNLAASLVSIFR